MNAFFSADGKDLSMILSTGPEEYQTLLFKDGIFDRFVLTDKKGKPVSLPIA